MRANYGYEGAIFPDCEDLKLQFIDLIERNGLSHHIHTCEDYVTISVKIERDFRNREHLKKRWNQDELRF